VKWFTIILFVFFLGGCGGNREIKIALYEKRTDSNPNSIISVDIYKEFPKEYIICQKWCLSYPIISKNPHKKTLIENRYWVSVWEDGNKVKTGILLDEYNAFFKKNKEFLRKFNALEREKIWEMYLTNPHY